MSAVKEALIKKIERDLSNLDPQEQLRLVEQMAKNLRKTVQKKPKELDWNKLYGLGKGIWESEDAQDYVSRLREDRS